MKPALNLAALASTLSGWLNENEVIFEEEDGYLSFDLLEIDKGPGLMRPRIHTYRFKRPTTIQKAYDEVVQVEIIKDSPEERKDFLWMYKYHLDLESL